MGEGELFEAAKNGYAMYGALAKQLMLKHGAAMVYEAVASMGEAAGRGSGERLKLGLDKFASQLLESQLVGGWRSEVKVEGNKVVLKNTPAPATPVCVRVGLVTMRLGRCVTVGGLVFRIVPRR